VNVTNETLSNTIELMTTELLQLKSFNGVWLKDGSQIGINADEAFNVTFELTVGTGVESGKSYGWTLKLMSNG